MSQQINDEEIRVFLNSQRKVRGFRILTNNIRKHFGSRALDSRGQIDEAFWGRLFEMNIESIQLYKSRYQTLLFRIIALATLLLAGGCLALYLWISK